MFVTWSDDAREELDLDVVKYLAEGGAGFSIPKHINGWICQT